MIISNFPSLPKVPDSLPDEASTLEYLWNLRSRILDELTIIRKALARADANSQVVAEAYNPDEIVQYSLPKKRIESAGYKVTDFAPLAHTHEYKRMQALVEAKEPGVPIDGEWLRVLVPYDCTIESVVGKSATAPTGNMTVSMAVNGLSKATAVFPASTSASCAALPLGLSRGDDVLLTMDDSAGATDVLLSFYGYIHDTEYTAVFTHNIPDAPVDGTIYSGLATQSASVSDGKAYSVTAPTGAMELLVKKNGTTMATCTWTGGNSTAAITGLPFNVASGDKITFVLSTSDGAEDLYVYLYGIVSDDAIPHYITVEEPGEVIDGTIYEEVIPCNCDVLAYGVKVQTTPDSALTLVMQVNGSDTLTATVTNPDTTAVVTGSYPALAEGDIVTFVLSGSTGSEDLSAYVYCLRR